MVTINLERSYGESHPVTMNLEKRIKRHVVGQRHDFFAVTLPGFENLCRQDLEGLSQTIRVGRVAKGGVPFTGRLSDLYLANLHLRTAGRILMRLDAFKATDFNQLEKRAGNLAWSLYLAEGVVPTFNITARHSRLYHTRAVSGRIARCIASHWSDLGIAAGPSTDQTVYVRLADDMVTISLDSSGDNLYRRGLKTHQARAPLRETTAAAILRLCGYAPGQPLIDPMCGSGTFGLEAALIAKAIAPGSFRRFAFMQWPAFRPRQWAHLAGLAAGERRRLGQPLIRSSDRDSACCDALRKCVQQNGLDDAVRVECLDFFDLRPPAAGPGLGLIVLNPPYGRRVAGENAPELFYHRIADKLRQDFRGWKAALLVPDQRLARSLDLPLAAFELSHGGLNLTLLAGRLH